MATDERRELLRLRSVLGAFLASAGAMPISLACSFLTVALTPERSLREYADITRLPSSTMSRHLLDLGERNRKREPGYGLIEQRQDPDDSRRNVYRLTPKGRALCQTIASPMEGERP